MPTAISELKTGFPNGTEWTLARSIGSYSPRSLYYANGIWICCCSYGILYSINGKEWTQSNITSPAGDSLYANGIWVCSLSSSLYYSTDGKVWTQSNLTNFSANINYANGIWIASCNNSSSSDLSKGIYYSTDGKTWTLSNITNKCSKNIFYSSGIWLTGGGYSSHLSYYSKDGKTWTQSNNIYLNIFYSANGIIVAGNKNNLYYSVIWE